jgi:hypothetical protein
MPANFHCHYQYASGRVVCVCARALLWEKMRPFCQKLAIMAEIGSFNAHECQPVMTKKPNTAISIQSQK